MDVWLWYGFFPHTLGSLAAVLGPRALVRRLARGRERRVRAGGRARAAPDARPLRQAPEDGGRVGLAPLVAALDARGDAGLVPAVEPGQRAAASPSRAAARPTPALTSWAVLGLRAAGASAPGSLAYLQSAGVDAADDQRRRARRAGRGGARRPSRRAARAHPRRREAERAGRRDARLDVLGDPRARLRAAGRDSLHRSAPGEERRVLVGRRRARPTRTTRRPRSRRSASPACTGAPVTRAVKFLLSFQNKDGGFELSQRPRLRHPVDRVGDPGPRGRGARRRRTPRSPISARMRRADGSYRYSAKYVTTPVWVTSQVLAALARKTVPARLEI